MFRNISRAAKPAPSLVSLLAAAAAPKHEWGKLAALPAVGGGYRDMFVAVVRDRPEDALTYAIQSLCRMVLEVVAAAAVPGVESWLAAAALAFAKQTLQLILRGQSLFSKPGTFNWAIFVSSGPEGAQDQVGDVGEDVMYELLEADTEEAPDDPFSGEGMDYDTSENEPNNEPE